MKFGSDRDMEGGTTKASSEGLFGLRFAPDFAKKMKPFSSDKKKKRRRLTPVSSESPQLSQGYRNKFAVMASSNQVLQEEDEDEGMGEIEEENQITSANFSENQEDQNTGENNNDTTNKHSSPIEIKGPDTYKRRSFGNEFFGGGATNRSSSPGLHNSGSISPLMKHTLITMASRTSAKRKSTKDSGFGDTYFDSEDESPLPDWCYNCQVSDEEEKSSPQQTEESQSPRRHRRVTPVPSSVAPKLLLRNSLSSDCLFVEEEDAEDIKIYNSDDDFIDPEIVTTNMAESPSDQPKWLGIIRKRLGFGSKGRSASLDHDNRSQTTHKKVFRYHSDGHDSSGESSPLSHQRRRGVTVKPSLDEILDSETDPNHEIEDDPQPEQRDTECFWRTCPGYSEKSPIMEHQDIEDLELTNNTDSPEISVNPTEDRDEIDGNIVPLWMRMAEASLAREDICDSHLDNEREDSDDETEDNDIKSRTRKKSKQKKSPRHQPLRTPQDQSTIDNESDDQLNDTDLRKIYSLTACPGKKYKRRKLTPMDKQTPTLDRVWECRSKPLQWMPVTGPDESQAQQTGSRW